MAEKLTQAEFIKKAHAAHGVGKYDFSLATYAGKTSKVKVGCPVHGFFELLPGSLFQGNGCQKCGYLRMGAAKTKRLSNFLARARAAHGEKYDYSLVTYAGSLGLVKIICPKHGEFEQSAKSHMAGRGCLNCGLDTIGNQKRGTLATFLARARAAHGEKYDYSLVTYSNGNTKVKIGCPEHGIFEQGPKSHALGGQGCPRCADVANGERQREQAAATFLARARAAHGEKYDYSLVTYAAANSKVSIICPEHGIFEQIPASHTQGIGCAKCGTVQTRRRWIEQATGHLCQLYFVRLFTKSESFYKVGITYQTLKKRFGLEGKTRIGTYRYEILAIHKSYNATAVFEWEQSILESFAHLKYWPQRPFIGQTECFSSCEEILEIFPL
ncbi:hypothetical protein [Hymenobacter properus]|uniref:GIY-YIG nuclease family protein n=1 Tax=Hymenobacter properus TaxID=2791026 RepID=A0A931FJR7_9BACT|nr:hypothetical protein [Hymenobacter properus]MBF9140850.1 hypothetical protein [Hymenobacter properus]MBR7719659.1 hypothetical protein [Microvirga sp. SRT04]